MTPNPELPQLERITFFPGQALAAKDLIALELANRELRELHNRSLHQWGIGTGFEVTGNLGDSLVTIAPGYGIDCQGREILLTEERTKAVPAVSRDAATGGDAVYYLVAAYQEDANQQVAERRPGVCLPGGTVRLTEDPLLDWHSADQLQIGNELILGKALVRNCVLSQPLSLAERRYARPPELPYLAVGQTEGGKTNWQPWSVGNPGQVIGLLLKVDTIAAGFKSIPAYFAEVVGTRLLRDLPSGPFILQTPAITIAAATPNEFTLQVLVQVASPTGQPVPQPTVSDLINSFFRPVWQVYWIGIER